MKRIVLILLVSVSPIFVKASVILTDSVYSKILSEWVKYNIYLPDDYQKDAKEYPVVYLLHGLSDNHEAWQKRGNMKLVADELIKSEEASEMLIVMPNAGDESVNEVWCGYFNMKEWKYEDFFFSEFIPNVEKKYGAYGDKWHRAIMGLSMGGGGSVVYCQHHPDMFSSCYAMSAWLDNNGQEVGNNPSKGGKLYYTCESVSRNSALEFIRKADDGTKEKLRTVKWFFDCGDDDFLLEMNMQMHMCMRRAGIYDEFRVRNGAHNWEYWHLALRQALPFASRYFRK